MCLHTLPNRSNQKPQSGLINRLFTVFQRMTAKNSPSKLEGAPEGEGVCLCCKGYSLQRGVLQGRLIRFAAFGCYGSAKCVNTLCSHLNRNLPSFLHTCYLSSPTLTNEEMRNDGFYSFLSNSIIKGLQNPILNFEFQNSPISRYELNKSHQQLNFHRKLLTLLLDWPRGWYE